MLKQRIKHFRLLAGALILCSGSIGLGRATAASSESSAEVLQLCGNGQYPYSFVNQNLNELWENDQHLRLRRLVTAQSSHIPPREKRHFLQLSPLVLDQQTLVIQPGSATPPSPLAESSARKVRFTVCSHNPQGQATVIDDFYLGSTSNESLTRAYQNLKDQRLSLRVQNLDTEHSADYLLDFQTPGEDQVWQPNTSAPTGAISGFADIHVHQAADLAFAGGWYWGSHREGPISERLPACTGKNHATVNQGPLRTGIALVDPHLPQQYAETHDWPHWNDIKHQQVSAQDLKMAHQNGLGLMIASLVSNQWLSSAMLATGQNKPSIPANDMDSVKTQLHSLWAMHENTDWYRIVRDPWEARRVAAQGKLPVILAIEADHLFPPGDGPWKQQLHDFYAMGVRTVQLAHETNTVFSGAAYHRDIFKPMGQIKALVKPNVEFDPGDGVHNPLGLTPLGYELLDEMIRLNMLIDLSHLSMTAQREIYAHVRDKHQGYPLYNSHTRFGPLLTPAGKAELKEFVTTPETAAFIRRTGGVIGLRTGEDPMEDYTSTQSNTILNNCDGSSRSLVQMYQAFDDLGVSVALASDFNGFITQAGPRYGPEACPNAPESQRQQQQEAQGSPPLGSRLLAEFNTRGISHMGLLPALIEDFGKLGANTDNLDHSAETFLRMWERAYDPQRELLP